MSDVFVSYRKSDAVLARQVVDALTAHGLSVWWDDSLTARSSWDAEIEHHIAAAATVVVLWTPRSVESDWVRTEAHYAQDHGKLIPVMLEPCVIPLAFTLRQTLDLTDWRGPDPSHRHWQKLVAWIADLSGGGTDARPPASGPARPAFRRAVGQTAHGEPIEDGALVTAATPVGTLFQDGDGLPVLRVVPAGAFVVGSPTSEPGRSPAEGPQTRIELPAPFAIGVVPLLQREREVLADGHVSAASVPAPALPATRISFDEAARLVETLSARTGEAYRIPSETEWEYACRAGTRTAYAFGSTIDRTQAAFDLTGGPVEAGQYRANAFGLFDMHGNVREWTADLWHESYDETPTDGTPALEGHSSMRVVRGGGWGDVASILRSAARLRATQSARSPHIGVRVVRALR